MALMLHKAEGMNNLSILLEQPSILGEGAIKFDRLKDQKKHEEGIEIRGKDASVGTIFVVLQWIYSKVRFLSDVVRKWDETLKEDETALHDLEEKIKDLRAPFQSTLDAVMQSVGIEQQIFLTHQMYPGTTLHLFK